MNKRIILALTGLAMMSQNAVSVIGLSSPSHVQAEPQQCNQNSDTTTTVTVVNNNITIDDMT
jgi:hypothetical protein